MATVAITINSRQYDVVANESAEYIQMLGEHINEKVNLVLKGGRNVMGERPIVLAALNICDEYFKAEEASRMFKSQLQMNAGKQNENGNSKPKQVSIDETAGEQIKFLEGQIEILENKIKKMEQDYASREKEILDMIDKT